MIGATSLICDNDRIEDSPALMIGHPRIPGVQLHRAMRSGEWHLLAYCPTVTGEQLVELGEWLAERGREHTSPPER